MERVPNDARQEAGPLVDATKQSRRPLWPVPGGRPVLVTPAWRRVPTPIPPPRDVVRKGKAEDLDHMTRG
jgi:hypothetical protein